MNPFRRKCLSLVIMMSVVESAGGGGPQIDTNPIPLTAVESTRLRSIGYRPETNTLAISFQPGVVYHYANVTPEQYAEFQAAESKGKWFGENLQHARVAHPFVKLVLAETAVGDEQPAKASSESDAPETAERQAA